ncbi:helix-turn-helix transcriptional regulator [Dokdonella ginsengisoli]|uniref:Helix-turn-helix transcriptional regulator n=1 Tax=Dokdonella ginsengisoli TaxID=363846 RepID=A0ABV9QYV3_9GAMM
MKRFADRLREARVAAGMTQEQLGFALGVTKSSVSAWENDRETPSFKLLPQLRAILRRSLDELVCGGPLTPLGVRDESAVYGDPALKARNREEQALLLRYRALPAKRRTALLEILRPSDD